MRRTDVINRFACAVLFSVLCLFGCKSDDPACETSVLSSSYNPANSTPNITKLEVQVIDVDCGIIAHRGAVSVRLLGSWGTEQYSPYDPPILKDGRIFSYDLGVYTNKNFPITATWLGPKTLQIKCPTCSPEKVFQKVTRVNDLDIEYVQ
jgi:hypothetical protein